MATNKTITADAKLLDGFKIELKAREFKMYIDQPPAMGGTNTGPNPLEYNLFSLAGCCVTIANLIAKQRKYAIRGLSAHAEASLNSEVFMGKNEEDRAGFQDINITLEIDADMTEEEKMAFAQEVEERCPVAENMLNASKIHLSVN
ncbi:MAG: OsmC family protein [Anaerolineaceae bacterium]|nr:OsmC family protein [Anaerolineaceae bacterium]